MTRCRVILIALIGTLLMAGSALAQIGREKHDHGFSKDVEAFHAALAPLWHAKAGNERSKEVCARAGELENLANDIHSADAKVLLKSLAVLKVKCQAGSDHVDPAFAQVHEAFHRLAEGKKH